MSVQRRRRWAGDGVHDVFVEVPLAKSDSYYPLTARALYLMLGVNEFSRGCY